MAGTTNAAGIINPIILPVAIIISVDPNSIQNICPARHEIISDNTTNPIPYNNFFIAPSFITLIYPVEPVILFYIYNTIPPFEPQEGLNSKPMISF